VIATHLLDRYTNEHSRFLVIDNTLVHYRIEGEGFPIVLLHGAFSSLHTFEDWTKSLKKTRKVIRLDLPGFGLTGPKPDNEYSITGHLRFIKRFLKMLGIEQFDLAGSSLGGWLSWELALRSPERVRKLILIDSAGFLDPTCIPAPFKLAQTPFFVKILKYTIRKNILESYVKQVYYDESKVDDALVQRYYDLFTRDGNPEAFVSMVNSKFKDNTRQLKKIDTPTLILWGNEDEWIPVEFGHEFHERMPNANMIIYKETGHLPMEEKGRKTVKDVLEFIAA